MTDPPLSLASRLPQVLRDASDLGAAANPLWELALLAMAALFSTSLSTDAPLSPAGLARTFFATRQTAVYADNEAAIALYQKFGFESEGLLRDYAVRGGQWVDALSMARLRSRATA